LGAAPRSSLRCPAASKVRHPPRDDGEESRHGTTRNRSLQTLRGSTRAHGGVSIRAALGPPISRTGGPTGGDRRALAVAARVADVNQESDAHRYPQTRHSKLREDADRVGLGRCSWPRLR